MKVLEEERQFVCSRCKQAFTVEADMEQFYYIFQPSR